MEAYEVLDKAVETWETCDSCNWSDDVTKEDTFMRLYEGLPICVTCAEKSGISYGALEEIARGAEWV